MSWTMSWNETMKAAAQAERTATATRIVVYAPWNWNPHDVWLTRAKQPREFGAEPTKTEASTPPRQDTAVRA